MGSFEDIEIEIVIGEDRASDRGYPDDFFTNIEGLYRFRNQTVGQAVSASRAIPEKSWL